MDEEIKKINEEVNPRALKFYLMWLKSLSPEDRKKELKAAQEEYLKSDK